MARVPELQQSQRMGLGGVSGFQDTQSARIQGDSISQLGKGVSNIGLMLKRLDGARKSTARQYVKEYLTEQYQNLRHDIDRSEGDGFNDREIFDTRSEEINAAAEEHFFEKYSGHYQDEIKAAIAGVRNGFRGKVLDSSIVRYKEAIKRERVEMDAMASASAYNAPDDLVGIAEEHQEALRGTLEALEVNERGIEDAIRSNSKALADSAIQGALDRGNYSVAKEILTQSEFGKFFTADEQNAKLEIIRNRQIQDQGLAWNQQDRQRAEEERTRRKQAEQITADLVTRMHMAEESGDHLMISQARSQAAEHYRNQDIDGTHFSGILSQSNSNYKRIDGKSSVAVAHLAYNSYEPSDIQAARNKVHRLSESGQMLPETTERWVKTLDKMEEQMMRDPSLANHVRTYQKRLEQFTMPHGLIEKIMDRNQPRATAMSAQKSLVESDFMKKIWEDGMSPQEAYVSVVKEHFGGVESLGHFPGYRGGRPNDEEELAELYRWGKARFPRGSKRWNEFKTYTMEAKMAIQRDQMIKQSEQMINQLYDQKERSQGREVIKRSVDDLVPFMQELMKPEAPGQLPAILQDNRPSIPFRR